MGQQTVTNFLITSGQFCPADCTCLPVQTDCCKCPLPRCLFVDIEGWGSGYIYYDVAGMGTPWRGFIYNSGSCPPVFWWVEFSCDCDTDPACGDDPDNCGWRILIEGYFDGLMSGGVPGTPLVSPPSFSTGWTCMDVQPCDYPSEAFGEGSHFFAELLEGGTTVTVSLPAAGKDCCPDSLCCDLTGSEELNLALTTDSDAMDFTLTNAAILPLTFNWNGAVQMDCGDGCIWVKNIGVYCIQGIWIIEITGYEYEPPCAACTWLACQDTYTCDPLMVEFDLGALFDCFVPSPAAPAGCTGTAILTLL